MKKRILQKVFAVLLAGTMTLGLLTACGGNDETSSEPSDSTSSAPAESSSADESEPVSTSTPESEPSSEVAGVEGWQPFAENVSLDIPVYDRGQEGVPTVSDNYWTKWIQENFGDKYNITVNFIPIPRSDVMTQYTLLASSKDLPTILMEYDYDKLAKWATDGYLRELDVELFKQIAPTYYARMEELDQLGYIPLNGTNYFVLAERPYYNVAYTYNNWVRMDWLRQVGYDHIPATRAEYLDAMQKIMDAGIAEHPGGGSMILSGQGADQNHGLRSFPLNEEEWALYGDYNIPSLGWAPNKLLLKRANEEYNLGITDPEYYTIDTETAKANFINGKTYKYGGYISASMDWLEAFYAENPDAELAVEVQAIEPDEAEGTVPSYRTDNPFGMMIGFSSQATDDEVKAAMMYMEWMRQEDVLFTMQWGIEGQTYTLDENGNPVSVPYEEQPTDVKQGYNNSKDYWCVVVESRNAGTAEENIALSAPQGLPVDFTDQLIQNYKNKVIAASNGWAIPDCMFAEAVEPAAEYGVELQSLYVELRDKLVMCDPDEFDSLYDQYTQQYLDAGYQEVIDARKKLYDEGMTSHLPQ